MEFEFSINSLFGDVVSKVDNRLMPHIRTAELCKEHRNQLKIVLDKMGEASARAQGLNGAITSGRKLEISDHHVYVMKDPDKNGSRGVVIGLIKVGHKKLFVYDSNGNQHEMEPLCVLDFYVHETRQRQGCGKRLFQHMLQAESVKHQHLAIDQPSKMFRGFLQKHFGLKAIIPQVNKFIVFEGFFKDRSDMPVREARAGSAGRPPTFPYRRPGSHNQSGHETIDRFGRRTLYRPPSAQPPSGRKQTSETVTQEKALLKDISVRPSSRQSEPQSVSAVEIRRPSPLESLHLNLSSLTQTRSQGLAAGVNGYSRHGRSSATPPPRPNSASKTKQNSATKHQAMEIDVQNSPNHCSVQNGVNGYTKRETTPPLLRREVTPVSHNDYMTRGGHLKLTPNATVPSLPSLNWRQPVSKLPPQAVSDTNNLARNLTSNTTWTVFGVIPSNYNRHRQYSEKKYQHTKLW